MRMRSVMFAARLLALGALATMAACAADGTRTSRGQGEGRDSAGSASGGGGGTDGFGNGQGEVTTTTLPDGAVVSTTDAFTRDDTDMSGLDAATLATLKQGGGACSVPPIYPYATTVFPRGLPAPTIMWSGAADAAYVHFRYANQGNVDYQFAIGPSDPGALRIPQDAWGRISRRSKNTPLLITLSVQRGAEISTCETSWVVAEGELSGALYYNTYNAPGAMFPNNGAVMRLTLGLDASEIYLQDLTPKNLLPSTGPCISCHSVSADGSTLVAARHDYVAKAFQVSSYAVAQTTQPMATAPIPNANFGGLYPDGTRMLTMGTPQCTGGAETFPRAPNGMPFVEGPDNARVVDTKTGADTHAQGLDPSFYMWMPQFSPDGKHVVFNHAKPDGKGGTDRRELAVLDYDYATNTFSNLRVIAGNLGPAPSQPYAPGGTGAGALPAGKNGCLLLLNVEDRAQLNAGSCTGPCYPAWPFFTPDSRGVVFLLTNQPDFASAFPGREVPSQGELWYADLASGQSVRLDHANTGLLPEDAVANYYPTVLPFAIGGYYWVFWTARRDYGNHAFPMPTFSGIPTTLISEQDAVRKRIWVTALHAIPEDSEFPQGLQDISAPGFFLDGQSESGNVRAFTTFNPCVQKGETCMSGLDCCSGFCFIPEESNGEFDVPPVGHCTDEPPLCSRINERCASSADCCPPKPGERENICIGGFCSFVVVPE